MEETSAASEGIAIIITLLIIFSPMVFSWLSRRKRKAGEKALAEALKAVRQAEEARTDIEKKYKPITDMEAHVNRLMQNVEEEVKSIRLEAERMYTKADKRLKNANEEAERIANEALQEALTSAASITNEAKEKLRVAKEKAESIGSSARIDADKIIEFANRRAEEIAGDALEAKGKADLYEATVQAMKNTINGYKDDYIIPNHAVLDDLADEYSHKEAGELLKQARKRVRGMVKDGYAGDCEYVEAHRRAYAIHFAVDAFNGKVDSALSKVKHDNFGKIKQEIIDAFALVNYNGGAFRNARIRQEYLDARLDELKWAVATHELRKIEQEEQREIRERMREEEKVRREIEKAIKEAEKEEWILQKALETARKELAKAHGEQRDQYEAQLAELEVKQQEVEARSERAMSMAQQTRRGHVYVISNIGSFGKNVFKIGMTRRLEPNDRVKELSDASVPFDFDVHAMIYSDDAPALENKLHQLFNMSSVNKVNPRKEFFSLNLSEIRQAVEKNGMNEIHWTMKAEALEYRESIIIAEKCNTIATKIRSAPPIEERQLTIA